MLVISARCPNNFKAAWVCEGDAATIEFFGDNLEFSETNINNFSMLKFKEATFTYISAICLVLINLMSRELGPLVSIGTLYSYNKVLPE